MPLVQGKSRSAISENISELARSGHKHKQAVAIALNTASQARAHGGSPKPRAVETNKTKAHWGPIHSNVAGRTDHLPMHVLSGSYVIPADIISGMGEGNTMAGFKVAKEIFTSPHDHEEGYARGGSPRNKKIDLPYGAKGIPYGGSKPLYGAKGLPYSVHRATGGNVEGHYGTVPIVAAGGEFVIPPWDVEYHGGGNLDDGHKVLDEFVKMERKKIVKTLKNLAGPKKN